MPAAVPPHPRRNPRPTATTEQFGYPYPVQLDGVTRADDREQLKRQRNFHRVGDAG